MARPDIDAIRSAKLVLLQSAAGLVKKVSRIVEVITVSADRSALFATRPLTNVCRIILEGATARVLVPEA